MNIWRNAIREYYLWRKYHWDKLRWLLWERHHPLTKKAFQLGDTAFSYFVHPYNHTWANERTVEIPVILHFLNHCPVSSTLEIGNVLSHYFDMYHPVIDKYEKCLFRPIIRRDLTEWESMRRFNAIVSISTIEHVGWDDDPRDEKKVMQAFYKIQSLLAPGGSALATVPVGYNHFLDKQMKKQAIDGALYRCMKRISADNEWIETDLDDALACEYGGSTMSANAVVFMLFHR